MESPDLTIVTVQTGSRYPDLWVSRLATMVARHLAEPHHFIIYTDRPDRDRFSKPSTSHQQLEVRDLEPGKLQGFFGKLRLFDQGLNQNKPFLFLDSTLVIRASLDPLIQLGRSSTSSLIGVRDWNYPILNSSVLWCQPDTKTQAVWEVWNEGHYTNKSFAGDQNFIFHVFNQHAPEALTYWPEGLVSSYKVLRKLADRYPVAAQQQVEASCILKFHGRPKPEDVLHPWRNPQNTILQNPLKPRLWSYLANEIGAHWH